LGKNALKIDPGSVSKTDWRHQRVEPVVGNTDISNCDAGSYLDISYFTKVCKWHFFVFWKTMQNAQL
jgi:hypothetical protein